jgi:hypothetical protein
MRERRAILSIGIAALAIGVACGSGSNGTSGGATPLACMGGGAVNDGGAISGDLQSTTSPAHVCTGVADWGTSSAGGPCQSSNDCHPTCCACPSGSYSAMVAWCKTGTCASPNDACCRFASGSESTLRLSMNLPVGGSHAASIPTGS